MGRLMPTPPIPAVPAAAVPTRALPVPARLALTLLGRLAQVAGLGIAVATLCFALAQALPGDAALSLASARYGAESAGPRAASVRAEAGLDRPALARWGAWMGALARLDLGTSLVSGRPVAELLRERAVRSWPLAAAALGIAVLVGVPLGIAAGLRPGGWLDGATAAAAAALISLPGFVAGLLLILVFSLWLHWLPPAGWGAPRQLVLPALAIGLRAAAPASRVVRNAVAATGGTAYVAFARWKGLSEATVLRRHRLRNAAIPVVVFLAVQAAHLIEGVVAVEALFAIPGLGLLMRDALLARDIPVVQGVALAAGAAFLAVNTLADLACLALDPRQRAGRPPT